MAAPGTTIAPMTPGPARICGTTEPARAGLGPDRGGRATRLEPGRGTRTEQGLGKSRLGCPEPARPLRPDGKRPLSARDERTQRKYMITFFGGLGAPRQ